MTRFTLNGRTVEVATAARPGAPRAPSAESMEVALASRAAEAADACASDRAYSNRTRVPVSVQDGYSAEGG